MQKNKMPINAVPYEHQKEAFEFVCKLFGLAGNEGEKNVGKSKMQSMSENISEKGM